MCGRERQGKERRREERGDKLTLWCWPGGGNMAGGEARNTQQESERGEMALGITKGVIEATPGT